MGLEENKDVFAIFVWKSLHDSGPIPGPLAPGEKQLAKQV
jgi:hypothetical protein